MRKFIENINPDIENWFEQLKEIYQFSWTKTGDKSYELRWLDYKIFIEIGNTTTIINELPYNKDVKNSLVEYVQYLNYGVYRDWYGDTMVLKKIFDPIIEYSFLKPEKMNIDQLYFVLRKHNLFDDIKRDSRKIILPDKIKNTIVNPELAEYGFFEVLRFDQFSRDI